MNSNVDGGAESEQQKPMMYMMEIDNSESVSESRASVVTTFDMPFSKSKLPDLQEAWPALESGLQEYGISCALDMDEYEIKFSTTKTTDPGDILNARYLLQLLSMEVPARRALRVLNGVPCAIIDIGFSKVGLCSKYGIKPDEYRERKKLLMSLPVQELAKVTGCEIYFRPFYNLVGAMGPVGGLKIVRRIVGECIVYKVPPAPRVRRFKTYVGMLKDLRTFSL